MSSKGLDLYWRDDDVSFFTTPREIEDAFSFAWNKGPVSLGIIPFDVYTEGRGDLTCFKQSVDKLHPLGDNSELCAYLRQLISQGRIYPMLHGYNHYYDFSQQDKYPAGIPEFVYCDDPAARLKAGKDHLEDQLGCEIKWFVPPSNQISLSSLEAVKAIGLNLPLVYPLRLRAKSSITHLLTYLQEKMRRFSNVTKSIKIDGTYEVECLSLTNSRCEWDDIAPLLPVNQIVIATHLWEINANPKLRGSLSKLIEEANSLKSFADLG